MKFSNQLSYFNICTLINLFAMENDYKELTIGWTQIQWPPTPLDEQFSRLGTQGRIWTIFSYKLLTRIQRRKICTESLLRICVTQSL